MWKIVEQEESIPFSSAKRAVTCKRFKVFFDGEGEPLPIKYLLLQIIVEDDTGYQVKLMLNCFQGIQFPKFTIRHPDGMERKKISIGSGKNRRVIADTLSPMIPKKGMKEEYNQAEFEIRLKQLIGSKVAEVVMGNFLQRITSFASAA